MLILQYKVSLLLIDLVVAFVLFIFVLAYCGNGIDARILDA